MAVTRIAVGKPAWSSAAWLTGVAAITAGLSVSRTSGTVPMAIHCSVKDVAFTGSGDAVKPYFRAETLWDFDDPTSTRTCIDAYGRTILLNSDQIGSEAAYVWDEGHGGSKTITVTHRSFNSVSNSFISASTTASITVGELSDLGTTPLYGYVDSVNGSDTNDGLDPNGFHLINAIYDPESGSLTGLGGSEFASYSQSAAVAPARELERTNYIYISSGLTAGRYKILGKISSATLQLETGLSGSVVNTVNSSTGPWKTLYESAGTKGNTFITGNTAGEWRVLLLARGSSWTNTHYMSGTYRPGRIISAYGSGADPIIQPASSGFTGPFLFYGNATAINSDWFIRGIVFDNNSVTSTYAFALSGSGSGYYERMYYDGCTFKNNVSSTSSVSCTLSNFASSQEFGFFNCTFDNPNINKSHVYVQVNQWVCLVGCNFSGGNSSDPVHDHYAYLNSCDNVCVAYCSFGSATSLGYALNMNCRSGSGLVTSYIDIRDCTFDGPTYAVDFSNTTNAETNGDFDYFAVRRNRFSIQVYGNNVKQIGLHHNRFVGIASENIRVGAQCHALDIDAYDNDASGTGAIVSLYPPSSGLGGDPTGRVWRNRHNQTGSGYSEAGVLGSGTVVWEQNQLHNTNTNAFYDIVSGAGKTKAQWQADGRDTDVDSTDPGFVDEASGYFSGRAPVLADSNGIIQVLSSGSYAASSCTQGDSVTDTWYLYNSGDQEISYDADSLAVTSSGTLVSVVDRYGNVVNTSSDQTFYPGDFWTIQVSRTTSVAGSKMYRIAFTAAVDGVPASLTYQFDTAFTVNAGGGGGTVIPTQWMMEMAGVL